MHETVISWNILEKVSQRVSQLNEKGLVKTVSVRVGEFTNVDPESLRFAYESMRYSYASCKYSSLVLEVVEALAVCNGEAHTYHAESVHSYKCPQCGSGIRQLVAGEELEIFDIEFAVTEATAVREVSAVAGADEVSAGNEEDNQKHARTNDGAHTGALA